MARYKNGFVPESALVTFHTGYTAGEGNWKWQLPPSPYRKHLALIALAKANTGRNLTLSNGWSGNRPYDAQVRARALYGNGAAWAGTSSHGGFWEGKDTAAMDYGNWSYVYGGNRAAFFRDVRAVGLEPDLISPRRGYPDEPWHVVDLDPYAGVPSGGGSGAETPIIELSEEDDMKFLYVTDSVDGNNIPGWALLNPRTGKLVTMRNNGKVSEQANADSWARVWGSAKICVRQDMLNAVAAIQQTL